jgi:hypothetical protein
MNLPTTLMQSPQPQYIAPAGIQSLSAHRSHISHPHPVRTLALRGRCYNAGFTSNAISEEVAAGNNAVRPQLLTTLQWINAEPEQGEHSPSLRARPGLCVKFDDGRPPG